jgi:hypothetical protein
MKRVWVWTLTQQQPTTECDHIEVAWALSDSVFSDTFTASAERQTGRL